MGGGHNLGRQHQKYLDPYFKGFCEYLYSFGVRSYYFIPSILLEIILYICRLIFMFLYLLNNMTTIDHL